MPSTNPRWFFSIPVLLGIAFQSLTLLFVRGAIPLSFHPSNPFNATRAHSHLSVIASAPRYIGSLHHNRTADYIEKTIVAHIASGGQLSRSIEVGEFGCHSGSGMNHFERQIRNIIVRNSPASAEVRPIVFSAHYDSHPNTVGAYDDGINVAVMLELALSLPRDFNVPVVFAFLGSEEHGMHGSRLLMNGTNAPSGNVLNLESMGVHRPFALVMTAGLCSSVVKTFARVPGALLATFFNDVGSHPKFTSFSDLVVYDEKGLSGGQTVFFGNPTLYHTKFDRPVDLEDIRYEGELLMSFLERYRSDATETAVVGFGVGPLGFVLSKDLLERASVSVAVVAIVGGVVTARAFIFVGVLFVVGYFSIFAGIARLLFFVNTFSYASNPLLYLALLKLAGCETVLSAPFDRKRVAGFSLFLNGILLLALRQTEMAVIFLLSLLPQIVSVLLGNVSVARVLLMVQILPTTLAFSLMYPVLVGYMSQFPPFAAELVPLFVAGFEALLFALGLHSLVGKRLHRGVLVALWLSVIVILAAKTPPYSEDFPIVGAESEFHFENGSSIASFTPVGGRRVIPGITEAPDIEFVQNYPGYLLPPGPAWLVRSKQTRPLTHRPTFSVVSTPGPFRQIHFDSGPLSDGIESVSLVVKCGDHECIERIEGFPEFRYRETSFGPFTAIVRFTPVLDRQTMDIWLTRFNISIDILYTSQAVSPERAKLRKSLGRHVCSFAKERFLADDVELFTNEV